MEGVVITITAIFGMLGAALVLLAFACGWLLGAKRTRGASPEPPSETERERLLCEQRAFHTLLRYSPEIAYGETMTEEG